jgi:hypothetical protein
VAAATVIATGMVALGVCAAPAQAAAPMTTAAAVTHVRSAARGPESSQEGVFPRTVTHAGATVRVAVPVGAPIRAAVAAPVQAAAVPAAAAADAADSSARSRLWHQTLAEFGILAVAFAVFARRSFRPRRAPRARVAENES